MADNTKQSNIAKLVTAHARHLHISPRKIRLVTNLVKGMYATDALIQLQHTNKKAAGMVTKLINSAIANAKHNFSIDPESLQIKSITAEAGKVMKRYFPRARGSASTIHRRMSHIHVVLEEKKRSKAKASRFEIFKKSAETEQVKGEKTQTASIEKAPAKEGKKSQVFKTEEQTKMNKIQQKRRLFNRKAGV